jgi:hypothetical protein
MSVEPCGFQSLPFFVQSFFSDIVMSLTFAMELSHQRLGNDDLIVGAAKPLVRPKIVPAPRRKVV